VPYERGFKRIGLTGTRWLVDSDVYPDALQRRGLCHSNGPSAEERDAVNGIIMNELVKGRFTGSAAEYLIGVIEGLQAGQGCDAVVLGCTEIPFDHQRRQLAVADARFDPVFSPGCLAPRRCRLGPRATEPRKVRQLNHAGG
jgi:aspartate/glutamate racemase